MVKIAMVNGGATVFSSRRDSRRKKPENAAAGSGRGKRSSLKDWN
jgi:hypothetical protein